MFEAQAVEQAAGHGRDFGEAALADVRHGDFDELLLQRAGTDEELPVRLAFHHAAHVVAVFQEQARLAELLINHRARLNDVQEQIPPAEARADGQQLRADDAVRERGVVADAVAVDALRGEQRGARALVAAALADFGEAGFEVGELPVFHEAGRGNGRQICFRAGCGWDTRAPTERGALLRRERGEEFLADVRDGREVGAAAGQALCAVQRVEDGATRVGRPAVAGVAEVERVEQQVLARGRGAQQRDGLGDDLRRAQIDQQLDEHLVHARAGVRVERLKPVQTSLPLGFVGWAEADEGEDQCSKQADLL